MYEEKAILDMRCLNSGSITCEATNEMGSAKKTRQILVYELPNGFGIYNQSDDKIFRFSEHENAVVKCVASIFEYKNVTWEKDGEELDNMGK